MREIDKYMSTSEAAYRWEVAETTLKNYLQGKIKDAIPVEEMIERGYLKYHIKPGGQRKEWIISVDAMNIWFPNKNEGGFSIMNMERKYIKHTIEDMEKRLEYVMEIMADHEEKKKLAESAIESNDSSSGSSLGLYGLSAGYIAMTESEIAFLKGKIDFLKGALEEDID